MISNRWIFRVMIFNNTLYLNGRLDVEDEEQLGFLNSLKLADTPNTRPNHAHCHYFYVLFRLKKMITFFFLVKF